MKLTCKFSTMVALIVVAFATSSCGTKRIVTDGSVAKTTTAEQKAQNATADNSSTELKQMNYLRKVADNAVYSKNIVSKIKCTISTGDNNISVGGSLHMRRDEVIRIQLIPFGLMEAGRLEFTKDYVLLVDRIHKEYVKASYSDVDFLKRNGLDFFALQALFWNQLFVPGAQKITDSSLKSFTAELSASPIKVSTAYGNMSYVWNTDNTTALINSVNAKYFGGKTGNTSVTCTYSNFKALGTKKFPTDIYLTMSTKMVKNASKMSLDLQLNTLSNDDDWEAETSISSKYTQVGADEILNKLGGL